MKKIQYAVWKKETNNAGGKAKNDAFDIAEQMGFEASYNPSEKRIIRVVQQYLSMRKFNNADVIFVQYPAIDFRILPNFLKHINPNQNSIALIHDLRSIQGSGTEEDVAEIPFLNHFKYVIAHNKHMAKFLKDNGYIGEVINLDLFDYLHDVNISIQNPIGDRSIAFAGNLVKSTFINELDQIENVRFILYGNKGNNDYSSMGNVSYYGSLPSDEIVYKLEGDYGLVWDGDSIDTCSGKHGEYLRFNNPHKLSLYIAAGKPVITWKEAAIADFVRDNNIGLVVDSLKELNTEVLSSSYEDMRNNVLKIKNELSGGNYLRRAIEKCLK